MAVMVSAGGMREVAVIDAEYRARRHDSDTLVEAALTWTVADGHPLHRFCAGNLASLGGDPVELLHALRFYHQRFLHAANMTLWLQGPQSEKALRAIADACAKGLPRRPPCPSRASLPPLVWRLPCPLTLCCPAIPRLVLAFFLTNASEGTTVPAPLFRQLLQDKAAGGLLDQLRASGLCDRVQLLPCDQTVNQGIVALVFSLLPGGLTRGQDIAALLRQWLAALRRQHSRLFPACTRRVGWACLTRGLCCS
ncbi:MAG: insulinase family protein [Sodalis sp. (in: enterobacteria)]|uniref:insulinase family protein n=1 Tax=Sodalis sp. (in: enterobacteria) TaxID=1898979 RepID=UPI003F31485D